MKRIALLSLAAAVFIGCQDGTLPTDTGLETPNFVINDGNTGGNDEVFFLPPLVVDPAGSGNFDVGGANSDLEGEVVARICELNTATPPACVVTVGPDLAMKFSDLGQHYFVIWFTRDFNLTIGKDYRIQIFLGTVRLAFRDVRPLANLKKKAARCDVVQLDFCLFKNGKNGARLPIKVRIEEFALCPGPPPVRGLA